MPRQKLSEYRAKNIIHQALNLPYTGWAVDLNTSLDEQLDNLESDSDSYVIKVDEGVKGRFKKGLVLLDVKKSNLAEAAQTLRGKGYNWLIVEPTFSHEPQEERYLSISGGRDGLTLQYSSSGGVNVEENADSMKSVKLDENENWERLTAGTGISETGLKNLISAFRDNYFAFLEINPYISRDGKLQILDSAVEVDDAAAFFIDSWHESDFRNHAHGVSEEERIVKELNENSPASLNLSVLEPDGSIFLLLSGGGASVVVADEVYNQGLGKQLANYGEYSGNPNAEETYAYTKQLLHLLLNSKAPRKVLFIGGAVANFTDVAKTFAGVIKAIEEVAGKLGEQGVKVFVRRGGPNQEKGLALMEATLSRYGLLGAVHNPETPLTAAVDEALRELDHA